MSARTSPRSGVRWERRVIASIAILAATISATMAPVSADAKPVLYLTFDDGPALDSATGSLLELLAAHDVTATFFVVGANVDRDPAMINRITDGGHALGNHSYDHVRLGPLSDADTRSQLQRAQQAVDRAGGPTMQCFRPPFGDTDGRVVSIGSSLGLSQQMWTLDTRDYERIDPQIYADVLGRATGGDVVLMHDGFGDGEMTVEAVRRFLVDRRDDFEFRALPGCLGSGSQPAPTTSTTTIPTTTTGAPTTTTLPPSTTTTAAPTTVTPSTTTSSSTPTSTVVETGELELQPAGSAALCRRGPTGAFVDPTDPLHGAVFRLYCSHLGRQPDRSGFEYWVGIAEDSSTLAPLSDSFLVSAEYQATFGDLEDSAFLDAVYDNVLGREPDDLGAQYWLRLLGPESTPRPSVMLAFSESPEFMAATNTN